MSALVFGEFAVQWQVAQAQQEVRPNLRHDHPQPDHQECLAALLCSITLCLNALRWERQICWELSWSGLLPKGLLASGRRNENEKAAHIGPPHHLSYPK